MNLDETQTRIKDLEKKLSLALIELAKKDQQLSALQEMQSTNEWGPYALKSGRYIVQIEVQKREIKELKKKYEDLKAATIPLVVFWSFCRASAEIDDHEIKPGDIVLSAMGHGGSAYVSAKEFDELARLCGEG